MIKEYVIVEGSNYEEALSKGLDQLKVQVSQVDIEVLEEKKAFLFGKSNTKLKVTIKSEVIDKALADVLDKVENSIENNIEVTPLKDEDFFSIDYQEDGIYLTIINNTALTHKEKVNNILDHLEKKSIEEYDTEAINKCIKEDIKEPFKIAPYQEEKLIDGEALVEVSRDKLEAYITIKEAVGGKDISIEEAKKILVDHGVIYGIDEAMISNIIQSKTFDNKILIAKGQKPQNGENGKLVYHFDVDKQHTPQLLEDGSVDFKHLNLINNVKKGQLLIEVIEPTDGIPGKNVLGEEISCLKGKPAKIIKGKNILEKDDGLKIYAAVDGQVFFRDNKLEVSQVYEVPGDVDHSTGNIKFNGKVVVKGNIMSGFTVDADGDIEVNGVVEGATLIAKGSIVLNRGVQGNNQAYLECNENLISKYVENSQIKCLGNIEADCILHSNVTAKGNVTVSGKRGLIVGGQIRAGEEIRAQTLGSHMGTVTIIEVGIDPDDKSKYEAIKVEITEIQKNLMNLKKTIELLNKMSKDGKLPKSKEEILIKSLKTFEYLKNKHTNLNNELKNLELKMEGSSKGKIHVSGKLYPGTKITILNAVRHMYDELSHTTLYRKEGDIVIGPYEK
ncbi:hypothetical protein SAMN05660297_00219 [Natronincola peptidivorans]|uniref:RNA-binding protein KhpB N-terminal domain-containing protein n=1 Tax=Natronincola peptidivorans TaxID=426128 RepID=A0A1H9YHH1_9FIRM|nr:FapA family protein [Natronincola peptidivorans]SES68033.1 hypothetical protein SAMN05660297_00219 [Natronincola peptidivorans]